MNFHNITHDDMNNGEGLRVVLWLAGCEHHCKDCHNAVTWNPDGGTEFTAKDANEIYCELEKDYVAGLTLTGGDPLHPANREELAHFLPFVKLGWPDKTIWVYTGYTWEEIRRKPELRVLMKYVDVLVDGRFDHTLKSETYPWAGSTNQRVIDVQRTLQEGRVILHESN